MPQKTIRDLTDDVVIFAPVPSSFAFRANGELCYVISTWAEDPIGAFCRLRRRMIVTHWITEFEPVDPCGIYVCVMKASDGSSQRLYFRREDVLHNMGVVAESLGFDGTDFAGGGCRI